MRQCITDVGFDSARKCAAQGWLNLRKAGVKPLFAVVPGVQNILVPEADVDANALLSNEVEEHTEKEVIEEALSPS